MAANTFDLFDVKTEDTIAMEIGRLWNDWKSKRDRHTGIQKELRDQVFAIDTTSTANNQNAFSNTVTIPKIMQIYQNIHAIAYDHAFSASDFIAWEAHDQDSALDDKRRTIQSYIRTKMDQQDILSTFSELMTDWILTGSCFCKLAYVDERKTDPTTGDEIPGFLGPKLFRIAPDDFVFNIAASDFKSAGKITKELISFGELAKRVKERPEEQGWTKDLLDDVLNMRMPFSGAEGRALTQSEIDKTKGYLADGFTSIEDYYQSRLIEVLTFTGDFYDNEKRELLENHTMVVVDRRKLIFSEPIKSWKGSDYIYNAIWTKRPDNLMGMGPLENLVGMQYMVDKWQNAKSDVIDQIIHPVVVESGDIEFYGERGTPNQRYVKTDPQDDVEFLRPDTTALAVSGELQLLLSLMEQMAGSPQQASGIRTPGEKTKFEVQLLDQGINRQFVRKVAQFEGMIEDIADDMLEMGRRNLDGPDLVRAQNNEFGAEQFVAITKEELTAVGHLRARGSSMFVERANQLQDIVALYNSNAGQIIIPHTSSVNLSKTLAELTNLEKNDIIQPYVAAVEQAEAQRVAQTAQQAVVEEDLLDEDDQIPQEGEAQLQTEQGTAEGITAAGGFL